MVSIIESSCLMKNRWVVNGYDVILRLTMNTIKECITACRGHEGWSYREITEGYDYYDELEYDEDTLGLNCRCFYPQFKNLTFQYDTNAVSGLHNCTGRNIVTKVQRVLGILSYFRVFHLILVSSRFRVLISEYRVVKSYFPILGFWNILGLFLSLLSLC